MSYTWTNDRPCGECIWRGADGCTSWDCNPVTRREARKRLKDGKWGDENECSECGCKPWYGGDIHTLKFCPNCGAQMSGGNGNV